jgi:catechol 2,3-dioxygenase-like lactoylglutathione lyase family enzyme
LHDRRSERFSVEVREGGMTLGLRRISQISINVHDVQRAIAFYRDTLGLKFLFEIPNAAFFECGGVRLYLALPARPELDHPSSILYYDVEDIWNSYESLLARGVKFENKPHLIARMPDHELWMAFFRDSEGNRFQLSCEVRQAG